jgi:uncharacterized protein (UPF0147 family)
MTTPEFNPEEFASNLAQEAIKQLPADLNEEQKKYVINKLSKFCVLAGDSIKNDPNHNFTLNEANAIVQLIGEWTFHKNIDLIRADIPEDCWGDVLQLIAYEVFEKAKNLQIKKVEQSKAISIIEDTVKDAYSRALMDIAKKGLIPEESIPEILSYSNIDAMAEQSQMSLTKEQENKILKCASLALLFKSMSHDKVNKILAGMDKETAEQIAHFMNIPDLEQKLDSDLVNRLLGNFKQNISNNPKPQKAKLSGKIKTLKNLYDDYLIVSKVNFERPVIKTFVQDSLMQKPSRNDITISPYIENIIYNYLVSKLTV